jgi:hypothetical protein
MAIFLFSFSQFTMPSICKKKVGGGEGKGWRTGSRVAEVGGGSGGCLKVKPIEEKEGRRRE